MRLALLMGRSLDDVLGSMPSWEFSYWLAFDEVHGLPDPWLQTGVLATAALLPYQKKGAKPPSPEKFIPARRSRLRGRQQSSKIIKQNMRLFAATLRGRKKGTDDGGTG